ncbi:hypothetical protein [Goodfellowiella coeruleoviolacea]|uniref:Secreted protein n=1 Tax=Goodfellowiella coeruleoviolacea TaxID=334858 RepID=A0AAE3GE68_9PSEU|nr:hypothetical protein [Goodfellowiella coeruleoviolacea]MCP2165684.1 hypothetical protein [Goodfellowiella coeruleoviolacea]
MLKKAGIVAAAAASLMMFGAPAFAAPAGPPATTTSAIADDDWSAASGIDTEEAEQNGLLNLNDTEILDNVNLCEIIPIIEVEIPIGDGAQGTNCQVANAEENQGVNSSNSEDPK